MEAQVTEKSSDECCDMRQLYVVELAAGTETLSYLFCFMIQRRTVVIILMKEWVRRVWTHSEKITGDVGDDTVIIELFFFWLFIFKL